MREIRSYGSEGGGQCLPTPITESDSCFHPVKAQGDDLRTLTVQDPGLAMLELAFARATPERG